MTEDAEQSAHLIGIEKGKSASRLVSAFVDHPP